ncbi:MAG: hypothetical protein IV100_16120 [Myxococcales bacterium]|nr:hypothetical protein [Myxococcales bacterium]
MNDLSRWPRLVHRRSNLNPKLRIASRRVAASALACASFGLTALVGCGGEAAPDGDPALTSDKDAEGESPLVGRRVASRLENDWGNQRYAEPWFRGTSPRVTEEQPRGGGSNAGEEVPPGGEDGSGGPDGPPAREEVPSPGSENEAPAGGSEEPRVAEVAAVDEDGSTETVAEGEVEDDGTIVVEGVPEEEKRPLILRVIEPDGSSGGSAIITPDDEGGLHAPPVSPESTAEAEAFRDLISGGAQPGEIDTAGLEESITSEMAGSASSGTPMADAVIASQEAEVAVLAGISSGSSGATVDAAALADARHDAHIALIDALVAADDAADEDAAWEAYEAATAAAIETTLGVDLAGQSAANAAAWAAVQITVDGSVGDAAWAAGAITTARLDLAAIADAGLSTAGTDAAFSAFFGAMATATSGAEAEAASATLGQTLATELQAALAAQSGDSAALDAFLTAAAEARVTFDAALASASNAQMVAAAWLEFHAAISAALGEAGAMGSAAVNVAGTVTGLGSLGVFSGLGEIGGELLLDVNVAFDAAAWADGGAHGLAGGISAAFDTAVSAALASVSENGTLSVLATSVIDAGGEATFDGVSLPVDESGAWAAGVSGVIAIATDVDGRIVAAAPVVVPDSDTPPESVEVAPISAELTAETLVYLESLAQDSALSPVLIATIVTDASARAMLAGDGLGAMHDACAAAQASLTSSLELSASAFITATAEAHADYLAGLSAATTAEARADVHAALEAALIAAVSDAAPTAPDAQSWADACATMDAAAVIALAGASKGPGSLSLVAIANAEARIDALVQSSAAISGHFDGSAKAEVQAAIDAAVDQMASAPTWAEAEAAGDTLVATVVGGIGVSGQVEALLVADGGLLAQATVEAAVAAALAQGTAWEAALQLAAKTEATFGSTSALHTVVATAHAALSASVSATFGQQLGAVNGEGSLVAAADVTATLMSTMCGAPAVQGSR